MIAQVVPAVRLPVKAGQSFDYIIPTSLAPAVMPGSVVVIPFAGRKIGGLVIGVSEISAHTKPLKEIIGLANGLNPLPTYIVELWTALAKKFATTLPRLIWTALPTIPSRSIITCCLPPIIPISRAGEIVRKNNDTRSRTVYVNYSNEVMEAVNELIPDTSGHQTLILVPTIDEAVAWSEKIKSSAVYHSSLAVGAKYDLACRTALGNINTVIGTKSAVFLPFGKLEQIIIIEAGSSSHLQEDSDPRFDARIVAQELVNATGAVVTAFDALPPLGMTTNGSNGRWHAQNEPRAVKTTVHDLNDAAKRAKARVLLSEPLLAAIDETIAAKKRALVLLNRRGVSTGFACKDCGVMVLCPSCGIPLTAHQERMNCAICERPYPLPEACINCGSVNFKAVGFGSKTLFDVMKKRYPAAKIVHVDRDVLRMDLDDADVVVGTTAIFGSLPPGHNKFDLAADALAGAGQIRSGIWSTEATARILRTLASLLTEDGQLHVQTFDPKASYLLALFDPQKFMANELTERTAFGYPPVKILINVLGAGIDERSLQDDAMGLVKNIGSRWPSVVCTEPGWGEPKRFRGKFRMSFSVKFPLGEAYDNLVQLLPPGWALEVKSL